MRHARYLNLRLLRTSNNAGRGWQGKGRGGSGCCGDSSIHAGAALRCLPSDSPDQKIYSNTGSSGGICVADRGEQVVFGLDDSATLIPRRASDTNTPEAGRYSTSEKAPGCDTAFEGQTKVESKRNCDSETWSVDDRRSDSTLTAADPVAISLRVSAGFMPDWDVAKSHEAADEQGGLAGYTTLHQAGAKWSAGYSAGQTLACLGDGSDECGRGCASGDVKIEVRKDTLATLALDQDAQRGLSEAMPNKSRIPQSPDLPRSGESCNGGSAKSRNPAGQVDHPWERRVSLKKTPQHHCDSSGGDGGGIEVVPGLLSQLEERSCIFDGPSSEFARVDSRERPTGDLGTVRDSDEQRQTVEAALLEIYIRRVADGRESLNLQAWSASAALLRLDVGSVLFTR